MKIINGKIAKCTNSELFSYYLSRGWDNIMSYTDFKKKCIKKGTKIIDKEINNGI